MPDVPWCTMAQISLTNLSSWLLGILGGDEGHSLEPLPGGQEGHQDHLACHNGSIEGVGLEQILLHVEHFD